MPHPLKGLQLAGLTALLLSFVKARTISITVADSQGAVSASFLHVRHTKENARHTGPQDSVLIEPGRRVGPLYVGDTRERALQLFPPEMKADRESPYPDCGTEYLWVDSKNPRQGNVFIGMREGLVSQIGSATTRFHTAEGLSSYSSPEDVQRHYKDLRAYSVRRLTWEALGGRPVVLWVNRNKGIGFVFAYSPEQRRRYVYEILVFKPKAGFCLEGSRSDSPEDMQELPPYALEPPNVLASAAATRRQANLP